MTGNPSGTKETFWAYAVGVFSAKLTLQKIGCYDEAKFKTVISETIWQELLELAQRDDKVRKLMQFEGLIK
jgi:hypothetical protein